MDTISPTTASPAPAKKDPALWTAAQKLEASFLAEMLKSAGVAKEPDAFGGGAGEAQFASFLREAQAKAMVEAGGIGLAEHLFNALVARQNAT